MAAIHIAARKGKYDVVDRLIKFGSNPTLKCWSGLFHMSPLHLAVYFAEDTSVENSWTIYKKTIEALLTVGFNKCHVDELDGLKRTPLHWAAERGFRKAIGFLVDNGANLSAKDIYGKTPLHYGVELNLQLGGEYDFFFRLISKASVNVQNDLKQTPLHVAADQHRGLDEDERKKYAKHHRIVYERNLKGRLLMIKRLLVAEPDTEIRDICDKRAIDLAVDKELIEILATSPEEAKAEIERAEGAAEYRERATDDKKRLNELKKSKKEDSRKQLISATALADIPVSLVEKSLKARSGYNRGEKRLVSPNETDSMFEKIRNEFEKSAEDLENQVYDEQMVNTARKRTKHILSKILIKTDKLKQLSGDFKDTRWMERCKEGGFSDEELNLTIKLIDYLCTGQKRSIF